MADVGRQPCLAKHPRVGARGERNQRALEATRNSLGHERCVGAIAWELGAERPAA